MPSDEKERLYDIVDVHPWVPLPAVAQMSTHAEASERHGEQR